jgi:two-component system, OmpR family, sensor histidine kinase KdpD
MDVELRRDPQRLLEQIEEEERRKKRGRLKIFLGYASGVGKSAKMLAEGLRRRERGEDVVVGAIQPTSSPEIERLVSRHEVIPTLKIGGRDVIDIERLLRRHPQVVAIDGLAYTNPAGSRHSERWQEIDELLSAGISVITSINLYYIRELQDEVAAITGKRPAETVPLEFLKKADDIEIVDAPARASVSRLREMALLVAAEVVETELRSYLQTHRIEEIWGTQERILVALTPRSDARPLLESGRRNADRFHGELFAAYVPQPGLSAEDEAALESNLAIAREVGATVKMLEGQRDPVKALITFAREIGITQIFMGHSMRKGWWHRLRGNPVERLIDIAEGIDVRVFPQRTGS